MTIEPVAARRRARPDRARGARRRQEHHRAAPHPRAPRGRRAGADPWPTSPAPTRSTTRSPSTPATWRSSGACGRTRSLAYRRDLHAYTPVPAGPRGVEPRRGDADAGRRVRGVRCAPPRRGRPAAGARRRRPGPSSPSGRSTGSASTRGSAGSDPTRRRRTPPRVPAGIPKPLTETEVDALLATAAGHEPRGAAGPGDPRGALRRRGADQRARRSRPGATSTSTPGRCGCSARGRRSGSCRSGARPGRRRSAPTWTTGPAGARAPRGARAGDAVFLNARGGRLTRQGVWMLVRAAGGRAGLGERVYPHVLRHSCATHMVDRGADIRVVQELLGPRQPRDHPGVHPGVGGPAAGGLRRRAPPGPPPVGGSAGESARRAVAFSGWPTRRMRLLRAQLQEERDRLAGPAPQARARHRTRT